jgi:hypothetical protein
MPPFDADERPDADLDAVITYVTYTAAFPR